MVNTQKGYAYPVWYGWVDDYREYGNETDDELPPNPGRVADVMLYLDKCICQDDPSVTLTEVMDLLDGYLGDGPEVEDNWTDLDTRTVQDLKGYLSGRYENQLEADGL